MSKTQDMLDNAKGIDAKLLNAVPKQTEVEAHPGLHASKLALEEDLEDYDPFGGNLNNRRVAERISRMPHAKFLNHSMPTHVGDPNKAREDVQQSKKVLPDPVVEEDFPQVQLPLTKPSAGSPAANKGKPAEPVAPPATPAPWVTPPAKPVGQ